MENEEYVVFPFQGASASNLSGRYQTFLQMLIPILAMNSFIMDNLLSLVVHQPQLQCVVALLLDLIKQLERAVDSYIQLFTPTLQCAVILYVIFPFYALVSNLTAGTRQQRKIFSCKSLGSCLWYWSNNWKQSSFRSQWNFHSHSYSSSSSFSTCCQLYSRSRCGCDFIDSKVF